MKRCTPVPFGAVADASGMQRSQQALGVGGDEVSGFGIVGGRNPSSSLALLRAAVERGTAAQQDNCPS